MKILILSNLYEPYARGGAEAVVKMTAEGLAARGHQVTVLTAGPLRYGFFPREEMMRGVRVLRFSPWNLYFVGNDWRFPKLVRFFARAFELVSPHPGLVVARILRISRPDVVMTHNLVGIGPRIPQAIRQARVRHIHVLHDVQLMYPSGLLMYGEEKRAEQSALRTWYERAMRRLMGSPDAVIAPSQWLLDLHVKRGFFPKSKTLVLPNPVDYPINSISSIRSINSIHLLYAGQLEPHKGVRWLLQNIVRARVENYKIDIAGAGSLESEIKKAAQKHPDRIVFLGKLDHAALVKKMSEVDALVVPSLCYENAPQIIAETRAVGLPVIASRIGGIPEMIIGGENGFLFTPGNTNEFLQALVKLKNIVRAEAASRSRELLMTTDQYLDKLLELW